MSELPKISVVIPAFNEEAYIGKCLDAIQRQTFQDFEIIVVDNNCTDKTAEIAKKYNAQVVQETTQGLTYAREKGFSVARSEIIARTDADSTPDPTWLQIIYDTFTNNPDVVAITGML